jgi:hypothetical protein
MSSEDSAINKTTTSNGSSSERGNRPPTFSGTRSELRNFIAKVDLYLRLHQDKFSTHDKKILFAISYLTGEAFEWSEGWMAQQKKDPTTKEPVLESYEAFKGALQDTYQPLNQAQDAMDKLYRIRQGNSPAEEFVTQFRLLARQAGLVINPNATATDTSDKLLREIFQRAINRGLFDRISIEPTQPTNLEEWIQTVLKRDLLWRTLQSRKELFGGRRPPDRKTLATRATAIRASTSKNPSRPTFTKLTQKERDYLIENNGCFKCRKLGHYSRDCKGTSDLPATTFRPNKPPGPSSTRDFKKKPTEKFSPTRIRALVAELKENEYEEFLHLMDRPASPSGSLSSNTENPVPDSSFH